VNVVIVGCGRTGAFLAELLDQGGDTVSIVDVERSAFSRLPSNFKGTPVLGNGTDMDILRQAGIESADGLPRAHPGRQPQPHGRADREEDLRRRAGLRKVNDPIRASTYRGQGIYTFSRTTILGTLLHAVLAGDKTIGPNLMKAAMKHDEELSAQLPNVER